MIWYEKILHDQSKMDRISFKYGVLKWVEDYSQEKRYNLLSFNKTIGSITWESNMDSLACGDIFGKKYYLDKKGIFRPHIRIKEDWKTDQYSELSYNKNTGSGDLRLLDGKIIDWRRNASWKNEWEFCEIGSKDKNYNTFVSFTSITSHVKSGCYVKVYDTFLNDEILSKMILLGMYFIAITVEDNIVSILD